MVKYKWSPTSTANEENQACLHYIFNLQPAVIHYIAVTLYLTNPRFVNNNIGPICFTGWWATIVRSCSILLQGDRRVWSYNYMDRWRRNQLIYTVTSPMCNFNHEPTQPRDECKVTGAWRSSRSHLFVDDSNPDPHGTPVPAWLSWSHFWWCAMHFVLLCRLFDRWQFIENMQLVQLTSNEQILLYGDSFLVVFVISIWK